MTIELRNVQIHDRLSEETIAFTASLYVEGKKIGWAKNSGNGGYTSYGLDNYHDNDAKEMLKLAEEYCESLPPNRFVHEGVKYENPMNLEITIDNLVDEAWREKENKRFKRLMTSHQKDSILVGVPNSGQYSRIKLATNKLPHTIESLSKTETGLMSLRYTIAKIVMGLKPGEKILNNNLPKEI